MNSKPEEKQTTREERPYEEVPSEKTSQKSEVPQFPPNDCYMEEEDMWTR